MEPPLPGSLTLLFLCFFSALIVRAIFSFLETSITALRLFKLKELAQQLRGYDALFHALEKNPHSVLMTILIANNVTDVIAAALATQITKIVFSRIGLSGGLGFSCGIGFASIAIIIFGEVIPKNLARRKGEEIFHYLLGLINFMFRIMHPFTSFLVTFTNKIAELLGCSDSGAGDWVSSEKEIRFMIDYINQKGLMDPGKTAMLKNIFDLENTIVKEVMVPAIDVISIASHASMQGALDLFLATIIRVCLYMKAIYTILLVWCTSKIFLSFLLKMNKNRSKSLCDLLCLYKKVYV